MWSRGKGGDNFKALPIAIFIDKNKTYFDTQVTRLYIDTRKKELVENRYKKMKKIWDDQHILIVEGAESRLGIGNNLFENSKSIQRIICPSKNAFSYYSQILNTVKDCNQRIVLIALGPTATVLAYDLCLEGYRALDIGHIDIEYEWFLSKTLEKVPVKNKYIGEISGGDNVLEINNNIYKKQIIKRIF
ncbi:GT-D fold domain-containing glycosyltransferase [Cetobacterium sp.]|uniref:GT-D fold domain-containing glycosyltransferase n=1 Tax=Cetobacterium sp. TaxID=2071632 RepID=UPI003F3A3BD5